MTPRAKVLTWLLAAAFAWALVALAAIAAVDTFGAGESASSCHTRKCWRVVHERRAWRVCVRRHGRRACAFRVRYRALSSSRRAYIAALMQCEAGRLPWDADGSGFMYRAEWTSGTWTNAGGRLVARPSLWEETVLVSRTLDRVGYHTSAGWPNCP